MAINKDNLIVSGFSGKVGRQMVIRHCKGQTVLASRPMRTGKINQSQENQMLRFKEATIYAKTALADPDLQKAYAAKAEQASKRLSAYNVAVSDYLSPPNIREVFVREYNGQPGDLIKVRATDDFLITKVTLEIQQSDGAVIESGKADPDKNGLDWNYTVQAVNASVVGSRLVVRVTDTPGNVTELDEII